MAKTAQTQYLIESAIFTADRRPDLPILKPIDLSGSIAELNIFESLELPYLTGTCALVDDVRFRDSVGIKGSERLTFTILATENSTPIIKTFMITGKLNGISRAEVKSLIEENSGSSVSTVSKKLNYLIIGDKPTKNKIDKAIELKITILNQNEFLKMLNITS